MAKIQPALTRLYFRIVGGNEPVENYYLDTSAAVSAVNRRFYRQGLNWAVAGFTVTNVNGAIGPTVQIQTIPTTWPLFNSWEKARQLKWDQDSQVLDDEPSIKPKFYDFKVFGDVQHYLDWDANGFQAHSDTSCPPAHTMIPLSVNPVLPGEVSPVIMGDWDYSQITIPNDGAPGVTNEYFMHFLGGNSSDTKSLIQGYANSRAVPQSPDPDTGTVSSPGWLTQMFDDGDNLPEIKDNLLDDQDELPYDKDTYPGEYASGANNFNGWNLVDFTEFQAGNSAVSSKVSMMGCQAPSGLVKFSVDGLTLNNEMVIQVDLVAGPHRGYLAAPMQEF